MDGDEPSTRGLRRRDVLRVGVAAVGGGIVTSATAWAAPRGPGRSSSDGAEALNTALRSDLPQRLGIGRVIWSVPTTLPLVAVTFDDGPDPRFTPRVLDALAAASVTATFNVMGHNAVAHPALLRRAVAAGHEIGNHTWTHDDLAMADPAIVEAQLVRGRDAIASLTSAAVTIFRPPRGELPGTALRTAARLGYDVVMWSLSRGPSGIGTPDEVADHVVEKARPGDILALHDGLGHATFSPRGAEARQLTARRDVEISALPAILARLRARGLQVVTVRDLLTRATQLAVPAPRSAPSS